MPIIKNMPIMNTTFCFGSMAKLNLGLSILGKLASGDYRLDTVMTRIPLYDEVCLDWQKQNKEIQITCDNKSVPLTGANSLYQAYQALQQQFDLPGVHIALQKNIPVGAGLGGGCFNAGILIKQLNHHLKLGISPAKMRKFCLTLGPNVAFAASRSGSVFERDHGLFNMKPLNLPSLPACRLAIAFGDTSLSEEETYRHLETIKFTPADQTTLLQALESKNLVQIAQSLNNDFTQLMYRRYPGLLEIKAQFMASGALGAGMTGRGSTMFALFPSGYKINVPFPITTLELKEKKNIRART